MSPLDAAKLFREKPISNIGSLALPLPIRHMRRKFFDKVATTFAIAGRPVRAAATVMEL
jgi:hypothetical protein